MSHIPNNHASLPHYPTHILYPLQRPARDTSPPYVPVLPISVTATSTSGAPPHPCPPSPTFSVRTAVWTEPSTPSSPQASLPTHSRAPSPPAHNTHLRAPTLTPYTNTPTGTTPRSHTAVSQDIESIDAKIEVTQLQLPPEHQPSQQHSKLRKRARENVSEEQQKAEKEYLVKKKRTTRGRDVVLPARYRALKSEE